jgi:SNF2 family DNA or RNA helicase
LFLDPGLGKTSITLAALDTLREQKLMRGALVIAPLRPCYLVWPEEIKKWADFNHLRTAILHGSRKEEALRSRADLYLINPEGLRWLFQKVGTLRSDAWPFDVLVVDESTKFKHTNTQRFKELRAPLAKFRRRYILTGTPAPNGLMDLFGQIYLLDLGHALGQYITHYRMKYFNAGGFGGYEWFLKKGADKLIYDRIAPLVLRMDQKDYLELPPLIETDHWVELPPEALRVYSDLEVKFIAELNSGKVKAATAGAAVTKLRQVANGGVYLDEVVNGKRRSEHLHDAKTDMLVELLEELSGQPTLVAYEFEHDLDRIKLALKREGFGDVPHLGGGVSAARAKAIADDWNAGKLPVLLGHPQSIAHGLNLQKTGRAVIWYSLTWDLELYDQFVRRIWRQGQTSRVFVHRILARDTVDVAVLAAIGAKAKVQGALLDALRKYYPPRRS